MVFWPHPGHPHKNTKTSATYTGSSNLQYGAERYENAEASNMCSDVTFYASDMQRLAIPPEEAFVLDFAFPVACVQLSLVLQVMLTRQQDNTLVC